MKYTVRDLQVDFATEQACLSWLVEWLYPDGITCKKCNQVTKHYPVTGRKTYACGTCGSQISPTAGTIFHKSSTPLSIWYHAFFLMATNKAGTSAAQLQRETGVTYKTAWRIMHQIRTLMEPDAEPLQGEIQVDGTFYHPNVYKRSSAQKRYGRTGQRAGQTLFGMIDQKGLVKVWHVEGEDATSVIPLIRQHVAPGTLVHSDGFPMYRKLPSMGYKHLWTDHSKLQFYTPDSSTQRIENFWSTMKPRLRGTYKHVSKQYLQSYANEYAWRYSNRGKPSMFWSLMARIGK